MSQRRTVLSQGPIHFQIHALPSNRVGVRWVLEEDGAQRAPTADANATVIVSGPIHVRMNDIACVASPVGYLSFDMSTD